MIIEPKTGNNLLVPLESYLPISSTQKKTCSRYPNFADLRESHMSQEIAPSLLRPQRPTLQPVERNQPVAAWDKAAPKKLPFPTENVLRTTMQKLSAGREYQDDESFKEFTKLSRTLEQTFSEARKVDRSEGERELKQGGLRRIDTDLRKLFKGLGMPPQLAKHFSRGISEAMLGDDVEQISFSLTSSRSFSLDSQQRQSGYLSYGDGSLVAAGVSSSFQLSAVQTRSLDVSINLRTGEFALNRTSSDSLSISSSSTAALASFTPAAEQAESAPAVRPAVTQEDFAAQVQSDNTLLQISRTVKQAAIMQLTPATNSAAEDSAEEELFTDGVQSLQQLVERMERLSEAAGDRFESLAQIRNLRIERDEEDDDDHLRFTIEAQAPIGLTAVDDQGRGTTIYPRPDGSIGKLAAETVNITA